MLACRSSSLGELIFLGEKLARFPSFYKLCGTCSAPEKRSCPTPFTQVRLGGGCGQLNARQLSGFKERENP